MEESLGGGAMADDRWWSQNYKKVISFDATDSGDIADKLTSISVEVIHVFQVPILYVFRLKHLSHFIYVFMLIIRAHQ